MTDFSNRIDLHIHTTVSDGTDTPEQLFENVKKLGLSVFSVTDHDAVKADRIISSLLKENDIHFISGIEFSCRDEKGKYHILGYGFKPDSEEINNTVALGHSLRMKKVGARLDFLKSRFGFSFPEEEICKLLSLDNPGKPHIANLMVKYGYAETKEDAIENYINGIHFKSEYLRPEQAIEGIIAGGGIPVLAHPFYGSGDELILGDDMENRLHRLMDFGLRGIEAYYSGFTVKLCSKALSLADKYDLFITAGSDYHGENKMVRLGENGLSTETACPDRLIRFLEACGVK